MSFSNADLLFFVCRISYRSVEFRDEIIKIIISLQSPWNRAKYKNRRQSNGRLKNQIYCDLFFHDDRLQCDEIRPDSGLQLPATLCELLEKAAISARSVTENLPYRPIAFSAHFQRHAESGRDQLAVRDRPSTSADLLALCSLKTIIKIIICQLAILFLKNSVER